MSDQNTYTQFGPDAPIEALNTDFSKCLPPNILTVKEQADCDKIVGSKASGSGFCSATNFGYDRMTYCACVNSAIPCPMLASAACANSANAYMPSKMLPTGAAFAECKDARICVNIVEVGGSQNIVSGITQECGAIQNVENIINTNRALAVIVFILIIILVILIAMRPEDSAMLPPPPDFDLSTRESTGF
jgi:hypothetical protein